MKEQADNKKRHYELQMGDLILVKSQPYRQHLVALRKHQKIGLRFFSPSKIIAKLSLVAYRLELLAAGKIHLVFRISLLKKIIGDGKDQYLPLPLTTLGQGPFFTAKIILATGTIM